MTSSRIEYLAIADLIPYARNARTHSESQIAKIAASITEFGFTNPVLIAADNTIIAGHGRVLGAKKLGLSSVPCIRLSHLTDKQRRAYTIADNALALDAEWDTKILGIELADLKALDVDFTSTGLDRESFNQMVNAAMRPEVDPDEAPEPRPEAFSKLGDVWLMGEHRLMCGDSTSRDLVAELTNAENVEMVWTDPPYGVAIGTKNKWLNSIARCNRVEEELENDAGGEAQIAEMLSKSFAAAVGTCVPGASFYVAAPAGPLHLLFGAALSDHGIWRQTIQWVKNAPTFSPLGVCYRWIAEPIFFGWLPNGAHRWYGGCTQTTVWNIDRPARSTEHPTMKPVELVSRAIENSTLTGEIVLDIFSGSGTTLIACEQTGRRCFAMEISPQYVDVAVRRWEKFTGKKAKRESDGAEMP